MTTTIKEFNKYGEELESLLCLRTSPIAVRMLRSEDEIPDGAYRPKRDKNKHYAQCQVFSLSRRDRMTVAMLKDDNWCLGPIMAYGLAEMPPPPPGADAAPSIQYKHFEYGQYVGILTAPLKTAQFEPDLVLIYSDTNQLRDMLLSLKEEEELPEFMEGLRKFDKESMFAHEQMMMESDFDQPDIYKEMFESWGMEHS